MACAASGSESAAAPTATHMNKTRRTFIVVSLHFAYDGSVTTAMHESYTTGEGKLNGAKMERRSAARLGGCRGGVPRRHPGRAARDAARPAGEDAGAPLFVAKGTSPSTAAEQ